MMTPFPGTVDFDGWEKKLGEDVEHVGQIPVTRYWLIPRNVRPQTFTPHPTMRSDEIRIRTQRVWDRFYRFSAIWKRSRCATSLKARLSFVFVSKLYWQMYANTGISTDSARRKSANRWARLLAKPCLRFFQAYVRTRTACATRKFLFGPNKKLLIRSSAARRSAGNRAANR
jgi:hypothetical protein